MCLFIERIGIHFPTVSALFPLHETDESWMRVKPIELLFVFSFYSVRPKQNLRQLRGRQWESYRQIVSFSFPLTNESLRHSHLQKEFDQQSFATQGFSRSCRSTARGYCWEEPVVSAWLAKSARYCGSFVLVLSVASARNGIPNSHHFGCVRSETDFTQLWNVRLRSQSLTIRRSFGLLYPNSKLYKRKLLVDQKWFTCYFNDYIDEQFTGIMILLELIKEYLYR